MWRKGIGTFAVELDNMDKMLIQTELTVIAGDQESYNISAEPIKLNVRQIFQNMSY